MRYLKMKDNVVQSVKIIADDAFKKLNNQKDFLACKDESVTDGCVHFKDKFYPPAPSEFHSFKDGEWVLKKDCESKIQDNKIIACLPGVQDFILAVVKKELGLSDDYDQIIEKIKGSL